MKREKISLNVVAEFDLDANGKPKFVSEGGLKHYMIRLRTDPIETAKVDTVVYKLHPTYYDSERVVVAVPKFEKYQFPEEITSFGDYKIAVSGSGSAGEVLVSKKLSQALADAYRDIKNPFILGAIEAIKRL